MSSEKIQAAITEALSPTLEDAIKSALAGCPDVTPADLLAEEVTEEDCRKLEQVMGRFTSTTNFLLAFKQVLIDLEAGPEAEALDKFIPIMAQTEAAAMNTPSPNG